MIKIHELKTETLAQKTIKNTVGRLFQILENQGIYDITNVRVEEDVSDIANADLDDIDIAHLISKIDEVEIKEEALELHSKIRKLQKSTQHNQKHEVLREDISLLFGHTVLLVGPSNSGKTSFIVSELSNLILGKSFLGSDCQKSDKCNTEIEVLHFDFDRSAMSLSSILKQSINEEDYKIIKDKYHFFNAQELDDMTLPPDRSVDYYKDQWEFVMQTTSANIILIDALSGLLNGRSENDNSSKNVITVLSDLAQKYNKVVIIIAHSSYKSDKVEARGASSFVDAVDFVFAYSNDLKIVLDNQYCFVNLLKCTKQRSLINEIDQNGEPESFFGSIKNYEMRYVIERVVYHLTEKDLERNNMQAAVRLGQKEITLKYLCKLASVTNASGFCKITKEGYSFGFQSAIELKDKKEQDFNDFLETASEHFSKIKLTRDSLRDYKVSYNDANSSKKVTFDNKNYAEIKDLISKSMQTPA